MSDVPALTFARDGAQRYPAALSPTDLDQLARTLDTTPADRAGVRLRDVAGLGTFLDAAGPVGGLAASILGPAARPVRVLLFDKSAANNWALGQLGAGLAPGPHHRGGGADGCAWLWPVERARGA
ncbi:hypothetical protein [Azospirillum sp. B4]|uniref:hypothetical protein n=1 Tax=Azospirillum sp. B4 TaxID=95605 RepID=UPI000349A699|nr:hypothetical protein [Azospirillum sp. B4]